MARQPFQSVTPGEALEISAAEWNALLGLARGQSFDISFDAEGSARRTTTFKVRNDSGADRGRFEVLKLNGPVFGPSDNLAEFENNVGLKGIAPAATTDPFCVLLEPVKSGRYAEAVLAGATLVQVNVTSASHGFANPTAADPSKLTSGASGLSRILWYEGGTGTKWSLVRLGDGLQYESVRKNSAGTVYTRPRLNFIEGMNITLTVADDATDDEVDITIASSGGGNATGITSLNGLTSGAQMFADVDDTNVTLTISSSSSTHTFTIGWTGTLAVTRGGTGLSTCTQGDLLYGSASNTLAALAKNTTATRYLANTGTSNNPAWNQVNLTNGVTSTLPVGNGGTGQTSYTKGDLLAATGATALGKLAVGTTGQVLTVDSTQTTGLKWAAGGGGGNATNDLLDGTNHVDTVAAAAARGALIVGNNTPKWGRLTLGSANTVLRSDGTDAAWGQVDLATDVVGNLSVSNLDSGTNASNTTYWCGNGAWVNPLSGGFTGNLSVCEGDGLHTWRFINGRVDSRT